jgi:hypothetical protein
VPDSIDPLALQDTLSAAYAGDGRHQDAIRLARRTLADRERQQGSGHPDTMAARAHLAGVCLAGGRPKDAIAHGKRTLEDRERVLGPDHMTRLGFMSGKRPASSAQRANGACWSTTLCS